MGRVEGDALPSRNQRCLKVAWDNGRLGRPPAFFVRSVEHGFAAAARRSVMQRINLSSPTSRMGTTLGAAGTIVRMRRTLHREVPV